jgi:hypothetical protein
MCSGTTAAPAGPRARDPQKFTLRRQSCNANVQEVHGYVAVVVRGDAEVALRAEQFVGREIDEADVVLERKAQADRVCVPARM